MSANTPKAREHRHLYQGLDRSVERVLGFDARLLYGMGVPMLMVVGLIVLLAFHPVTWLAAVIVVFEVAALVVVISGLTGMMRDDRNEQA